MLVDIYYTKCLILEIISSLINNNNNHNTLKMLTNL